MKSIVFLPAIFLFFFLQPALFKIIKSSEPAGSEMLVTTPAATSFYFKANGVDPVWSLTISNMQIEFKTQASGFLPYTAPHVEPVRAMDSNVKVYKVQSDMGEMEVEITKVLCQNENSHERFPYGVTVSLKEGKDTTFTYFTGCGLYITDANLEHTWTLDQIKTDTVNAKQFNDTLPFIELHANGNSLSGYGGCNTIKGRIFSERNLLRFTDLVLSKRTCDPANREKDFISALKFSTQYVIEGDRLILSNPSGQTLVFKKSM